MVATHVLSNRLAYELVKSLCPAPEISVTLYTNYNKVKKIIFYKSKKKWSLLKDLRKQKKKLKTFLGLIYSIYSLNKHLLNRIYEALCWIQK